MRLGIGDPGSLNYLGIEQVLNDWTTERFASKHAKHVVILDIAGNPVSPSGIGSDVIDGRQTVTNSGTAVALGATTTITEVTIMAETNNSGTITVGGSTVVDAEATRRGVSLESGETITLKVNDLAKIFIDASVNTDGVTYTAITP